MSVLNISQYFKLKLMKTMILQLLYKTNLEFYGLLMYLSPVSSSQFLAD